MAHFESPFKRDPAERPVTKAMLLAAGRGERMAAHTESLPKPLLNVAGKPLITRNLEALALAGIREIVVNVAYRGEMIRQALGDGSAYGVTIRYSDEGAQALETAGGIIHALPLLGTEPFVVVSADVVHDVDVAALGLSPGRLGQLVLVPNPPHHPRGDFGLTVRAALTLAPPRLTFAGIGLLDPSLFVGVAPGPRPLRDILRPAIARGELTGYQHRGLWIDVGTPARLRVAAELLARLR